MLSLEECLAQHQLTIPNGFKAEQVRALRHLTEVLDNGGLLSKPILDLFLSPGFPITYAKELINFTGFERIQFERLLDINDVELFYELFSAIKALNEMHDMSSELFEWLIDLKENACNLSECYSQLKALSYPLDEIKTLISANKDCPYPLMSACSVVYEARVRDLECLTRLVDLFNNPLILGAYQRIRSPINSYLCNELLLLTGDRDLNQEDTVLLVFNLLNRTYEAPLRQPLPDEYNEIHRIEHDSEDFSFDSSQDDKLIATLTFEAIETYFRNKPLETIEDYQTFDNELRRAKAPGGIDELWPDVQFIVANTINSNDPWRCYESYQQLIQETEKGKAADLSTLDFREKVQESPGYRAFCVQSLEQSRTRQQHQRAQHLLAECGRTPPSQSAESFSL